MKYKIVKVSNTSCLTALNEMTNLWFFLQFMLMTIHNLNWQVSLYWYIVSIQFVFISWGFTAMKCRKLMRIQKILLNLMYYCCHAALTALVRTSLFPPPHSDQYYINTSSLPSMKNVLVLTMPNTRNYTVNTDLKGNSTVRISKLPSSLVVVLLLHNGYMYKM